MFHGHVSRASPALGDQRAGSDTHVIVSRSNFCFGAFKIASFAISRTGTLLGPRRPATLVGFWKDAAPPRPAALPLRFHPVERSQRQVERQPVG